METHTPIEKLMTEELETVSSNTDISEAAYTLLEQVAGSLVILDDENQVEGIVTCTDITEFVANNGSSTGETVDEYMTTDVVTISPDETIQDAAVKMITNGIQHLPVTNSDGEMIGMVSTTDLTDHLTFMDSMGTD